MPSRFFVPIVGLDPERVRPDQVHAACTAWFDRSTVEHIANDKPYAVSPLTGDSRGQVGVEVATLTPEAAERLAQKVAPGATVRLGNQTRPLGRPHLMHSETWAELVTHNDDCRWRLSFETPVTFRSGDRASPLPQPRTILQGLSRAWQTWSDTPLPPIDDLLTAVWVSDLDLHSTTVPLRVNRRDGGRQEVLLSGSLGTLVLRCDDSTRAAAVGLLMRLAAYTGVGSMTLKGLGVTRVRAHQRARANGLAAPRVEAATGGAAR